MWGIYTNDGDGWTLCNWTPLFDRESEAWSYLGEVASQPHAFDGPTYVNWVS